MKQTSLFLLFQINGKIFDSNESPGMNKEGKSKVQEMKMTPTVSLLPPDDHVHQERKRLRVDYVHTGISFLNWRKENLTHDFKN